MAARQMDVAHGRRDVTVAEQALHGGQIHAGFDQVSGEGVPQRVDAPFRGDAGGIARGAIDPLRGAYIDRGVARGVGE
jgi:hypothetical protein